MTTYTFTIDEQTFAVEIGSILGNIANVTVNQVPYRVRIDGSSHISSPAAAPMPAPRPAAPRAEAPRPAAPKPAAPKPAAPKPAAPKAAGGGQTITAPIPGKVMAVTVKAGDAVTAGQVVAVIEAMKMENNIVSPVDGTVKEVSVAKDADISTGDVIMVIG